MGGVKGYFLVQSVINCFGSYSVDRFFQAWCPRSEAQQKPFTPRLPPLRPLLLHVFFFSRPAAGTGGGKPPLLSDPFSSGAAASANQGLLPT